MIPTYFGRTSSSVPNLQCRPVMEYLESRTAPGALFGGFLGDPLASADPVARTAAPIPVVAMSTQSELPNGAHTNESRVQTCPVELNLANQDSRIPPGSQFGDPLSAPPLNVFKPDGNDQLDPPENLSGRIVGTNGGYVDILLSWTYLDIGAKHFQIDRSTSLDNHVAVGKVDYITDVSNYKFLDRHLPAGPTYHYWVKAVNGFNHSPWSQVFTIPTA